MKSKKIFSNCPLCFSSNTTKLWEASSSEQASHFLSPLVNRDKYKKLKEHIEYLQKSPFVSLNKCSDCNFIYSFPNVSGDKKFYDLIFSNTNKYPQNRWEFIKSIEIIKNSKFKNPKILELGSGDGAFVRKLVKKRITTKNLITAIEYSIFGKTKIKKFGIECLSIDIKDDKNKLPHKEYDYICLFQVLEHLDDIQKLVNRLKKLLSKKGEILIAVPNEKIIEFNELNGALLDMPPNHIGRWSKNSFIKFCDLNKINLLEHGVEPFSLRKFLLMFFSYRFLRKAQKHTSIAAFIKYKSKKNIARILTILFIIADFFSSPKIVLKIIFSAHKLGGETQLARISKAGNK